MVDIATTVESFSSSLDALAAGLDADAAGGALGADLTSTLVTHVTSGPTAFILPGIGAMLLFRVLRAIAFPKRGRRSEDPGLPKIYHIPEPSPAAIVGPDVTPRRPAHLAAAPATQRPVAATSRPVASSQTDQSTVTALETCRVAPCALFNRAEARLHGLLEDFVEYEGFAMGLRVHAHVALAEVFQIADAPNRAASLAAQKGFETRRIDFLIADQDGMPRLGIDFQSLGAMNGTGKPIDRTKRAIFAQAGLPLIEVRSGYDWSREEARLAEALGLEAMPTGIPAPAAPLPDDVLVLSQSDRIPEGAPVAPRRVTSRLESALMPS